MTVNIKKEIWKSAAKPKRAQLLREGSETREMLVLLVVLLLLVGSALHLILV